MPDTTVPAAAAALEEAGWCRHCPPTDSELAGLFGHDPTGHRMINTLMRFGIRTCTQLAGLSTLDLLLIRGLGEGAVARIRGVFPEPKRAPRAPAPPAAAPPQDESPEGPGEAGEREQHFALLTRLPVEVDITVQALTDHTTAAPLWLLTAVSRTDPRIWRHVHRTGISFARILDEPDFTPAERMLVRLARSVAGRQRNAAIRVDLAGLAGHLDDDQWRALLAALQVCRTGLRGS